METLKPVLLAALLAVLAGLSACGTVAVPTRTLTPVAVQLRWTHQSQFAGFYVADQKGYYAAEGLAVTLIEGGPAVDLVTPLVEHAVQFTVAGAEAGIVARSEGKTVRAIATIFRRSPLAFMTMADSGITRPKDFAGKVIEIAVPARVVFHTMMANAGIPPSSYSEVTLGSDLSPLYTGQVQGWSVYANIQPIITRRAGYAVNLVFPDDYGVHFYGDCIFTTDELVDTNPDLARRFLRASLKGWNYAVENAAEIGPLVARYNPNADVEIETDSMFASQPMINTGEDHIGSMKPEVWVAMEATLRQNGAITGSIDPTAAYTLQFLREIYGQ